MGYLDNSSITVDAVLTKKGREILKDGGNLNITSFTLSDTGVDYTLWNPDHPSGSAFYGEAIENLPMLEASVHAEYNSRNRLMTMSQNTVALPAIKVGNLDSANGIVKTFNEGDEGSGAITVEMVGFVPSQNLGYLVIIQDPTVVSTNATQVAGGNLSGTSRQFLQSEDIPQAREYQFTGNSFTITPIQQDSTNRQTNVYIVDIETGAYNSFQVVNNITKTSKTLLSSGGAG